MKEAQDIPTKSQVPHLYYRWGNRPKVEVLKNGCWQWIGCIHRLGYGICNALGEILAHRVVYREVVGKIPEGMTIDHLCRNRSCVNPSHLETVSLAENVRRSPRTKLSQDDVDFILQSSSGHAELGRKFGVSREAIFRIRRGLMWKK